MQNTPLDKSYTLVALPTKVDLIVYDITGLKEGKVLRQVARVGPERLRKLHPMLCKAQGALMRFVLP
jgi:hypothetical protein